MSDDPVAELLHVLDLQDLGDAYISVEGVAGDQETALGRSSATVFVGQSQRMPHGRVFGGQVLAQCVVAAGWTVLRFSSADLLGRPEEVIAEIRAAVGR